MTWQPIVQRELRVFSRSPVVYWRRLLTPAAALLILTLIFAQELTERQNPESGRMVFLWTAWLGFFYAWFTGFALTADCLSQEKRENTLGLLFLTDLRGFDIVCGKVVSHSLVALGGLAAAIPLLMIPVLLGGVTLGVVLKTAATLLLAMVLSLAVGIFFSALCRNGRLSAGLSLGVIVALCLSEAVLLPLASAQGEPDEGSWKILIPLARLLNPVYTLHQATEMSWMALVPQYFLSWEKLICAQTLLSVGLMVEACLVTERIYQERPVAPRSLWPQIRHWLVFGPGWYQRWVRRRWFGKDPVAWMVVRPAFKPVVIWSAVALPVILWACFRLLEGLDSRATYLWVAWLAMATFKLALAVEASQGLAQELRQDEMAPLLGTAWSDADFLRSHWRALRVLFLKPMYWVICLAVAAVVHILLSSGWSGTPEGNQHRMQLVLGAAVMLLLLVMDIWALGWFGLWQGLTARRQVRGATVTLFAVLWAPSLLFFILLPLGVFIDYFLDYVSGRISLTHVPWVLLNLGGSGVLGCLAKERVSLDFRSLALKYQHGAAGARPLDRH